MALVPRNKYIFVFLVAALLASMHSALPSFAQTSGPPGKSPNQKYHIVLEKVAMNDVLEAIRTKTNSSIVVDGAPMPKKIDFAIEGTLHEILDKAANSFDYSWTLSKSGIILMTKKFTDPAERPQINLPEMLEMTRNIIRALQTVEYDRDVSHAKALVKEMAQTFTPEQVKALDSGSKLRGNDLLATQKQKLTEAIYAREFAEALNLWIDLLPKIENMPVASLRARKRSGDRSNDLHPRFDYLYTYRIKGGPLSVTELRHTKYTNNLETLETP